MLVRAIHALQGLDGTTAPGDTVEVEDAQARSLIALGAAEAVEAPKPDARKSKTAKKSAKGEEPEGGA